MEGGVAHGFNAATPFAGVFPLNVLVALPNISGKKPKKVIIWQL